MRRIIELLEEDDARLSSTRLCVLIGQFVGAAVITKLTWNDKLTLDMFSAFLIYSGGLYGFNRYQAASENKAQSAASKPAPIIPVVPAQPININLPGNDVSAKDVTVKAQGDVNVS